MRGVSPELKSWVELVEKSLLIISTSIIILTSAYQGNDFIESKIKQTEAQKLEIVQRTTAIELLTSTYTRLLSQLDEDIKVLDEKMSNEVWKDSYGWVKFSAIREAKVKDRNSLLQSLGTQVVQFKEAEK